MRTALLAAAGAATLLAGAALAQDPEAAAPAPSVRVEKTIALADAFPENPAAQSHVFRARQIVLAPGARTEMMSHAGRPAITYVTQGPVLEHRAGAETPVARQTGAATMDRSAVTHYWENAGAGPAVLLIVEVAPVPQP